MESKLIPAQTNGNLEELLERFRNRKMAQGWRERVDETIKYVEYIRNKVNALPHWVVFSHMVWIHFGETPNFYGREHKVKLTTSVNRGTYHFSYNLDDDGSLKEIQVDSIDKAHKILVERLG